MLVVILLLVGHLSYLRVDAANTLITSVNMVESSFIIVFESTPARFAATEDLNSTPMLLAANLTSTPERGLATSNIITSISLLSTTIGVQHTPTVQQITTTPESMTNPKTILTLTRTIVGSLTVETAKFMTTQSPLPSVKTATSEEPQTSGGIVAAIVVTIFTFIIVLVGVTVAVLIICLKRRRRGRKYILGALKDGDTRGIFINDGAIMESGAENKATNSKLNHSLSITTSDFSGDHVYEMTEMVQTAGQPETPSYGSPPSTEQISSIMSRRHTVSSSWRGKHMQQNQSFPQYENTKVLHRYNSVGDYEIMRPQLQKIINKRHTQAELETVDIYSEVEHGAGNKDELYIEMKPEEMPNLSSAGENLDSQTHKVHKLAQQITEDDKAEIYTEMKTEDKTTSFSEHTITSQTSDNTQEPVTEFENAEKVQNGVTDSEGVTDVCTPLATDKDKQLDKQTSNDQTPTQHTEQSSTYIDMEQNSMDHNGLPEHADLPAGQVDELNSIYIEMEQDTTNPLTPDLSSNNELDHPVTEEDNIYIEMEQDEALDMSHSPHDNPETADDQILSQGSEDIYIVMH